MECMYSINLGSSVTNAHAIQNTRLLFNFLCFQPDQYAQIATKNIVTKPLINMGINVLTKLRQVLYH